MNPAQLFSDIKSWPNEPENWRKRFLVQCCVASVGAVSNTYVIAPENKLKEIVDDLMSMGFTTFVVPKNDGCLIRVDW